MIYRELKTFCYRFYRFSFFFLTYMVAFSIRPLLLMVILLVRNLIFVGTVQLLALIEKSRTTSRIQQSLVEIRNL